MAKDSESMRDGLNAMGNPDLETRSVDGGRSGEGPLGNVRPSGILARGTADAKMRAGLNISRSESKLREGKSR